MLVVQKFVFAAQYFVPCRTVLRACAHTVKHSETCETCGRDCMVNHIEVEAAKHNNCSSNQAPYTKHLFEGKSE
jgi:hypothetical protein